MLLQAAVKIYFLLDEADLIVQRSEPVVQRGFNTAWGL